MNTLHTPKMNYRATLLLLILKCTFTSLNAQPTTGVPTNFHYNYCEIIGERRSPIAPIDVTVDYGEPVKRSKAARAQQEQQGKRIHFDSMAEAMNHLDKEGWEFVQAYVESIEGRSYLHWILRKKIVEVEER